MSRFTGALLLATSLVAHAQARPTGACTFVGFQTDSSTPPILAEVATKAPAQTWMACDSPRGCIALKVQPGSPVLVYNTQGDWTCGYSADRNGAGPAWFRSSDLHPLDIEAHPPLAAWLGSWKGGEDRVTITAAKDGKTLHLSGGAVWQGANNNQHFGDTQGDATPSGNRLHYVDGGCTIDLTLAGKYILADDNNGCGGMNVRFSGFWKRTPAPTRPH